MKQKVSISTIPTCCALVQIQVNIYKKSLQKKSDQGCRQYEIYNYVSRVTLAAVYKQPLYKRVDQYMLGSTLLVASFLSCCDALLIDVFVDCVSDALLLC